MPLPIIDHYQRWICGSAEVLLGVREGIVLFARCDCLRDNRDADLLIEFPEPDDVWSYETSYCVHSYTVLAHFYARFGDSDLETHRIDDDFEPESDES